MQTQAWRAGSSRTAGCDDAPRYDFAALHHLVGRLQREDRAWGAWFAEQTMEPLELFYEDFVGEPRAAADAVARCIGVTLEPLAGDAGPPLARQADDTSASWAQRYLVEVG